MANIILKKGTKDDISFNAIEMIKNMNGMSDQEIQEAFERIKAGGELRIRGIRPEKIKSVINDFSGEGFCAIEVSTNEEKEHFKPVIQAEKISQVGREETLEVLSEVKKIIEEYEQCEQDIKFLNVDLKMEYSEAESIRKKVTRKTRNIIRIGTLISALIGFFVGSIFGAVIFAVLVRIILNCTIKKKDLMEHEIENNIEAEKYIKEKVVPIKKQLNELVNLRANLVDGGKYEWVINIVGEEMFYSPCVEDLYELVKSRRADNIKEALNKYDETKYKARMEEMQRSIRNSAEISASESMKQTKKMERIEEYTKKTAKSAKKSAHYSFLSWWDK